MNIVETRKIVNVIKENRLEFYLDHLEKQMKTFKSIEGVVGITLNGGLSRGYGDHLSEVDVTIYLNKESYENYNSGKLQFKEGICILNYAKVLYDPEGLIQALIDEKLTTKISIDQIGGPMFDAFWNYRLAGDIWNQINSYGIEEHNLSDALDLTKKGFYDRVVSVLQKESYSTEEFSEICSLRSINSDPFAEFIRHEDGQVIVDKEKFMSLEEGSMYAWQFDIVKAVQGEQKDLL